MKREPQVSSCGAIHVRGAKVANAGREHFREGPVAESPNTLVKGSYRGNPGPARHIRVVGVPPVQPRIKYVWLPHPWSLQCPYLLLKKRNLTGGDTPLVLRFRRQACGGCGPFIIPPHFLDPFFDTFSLHRATVDPAGRG